MTIASDIYQLIGNKNKKPKILTLDIETGPNIASVWRLFDENIGINQIHKAGEVISWAAKWEHSPEIMFSSVYHDGEEAMVFAIWDLLFEADIVQHWNGKKFDIPWLNTMFLKYHLDPPKPFKEYDLMHAVKSRFKFASYKLDFVSQALGVGRKVDTGGYELWHKCLFGTPEEKAEAWELMRIYNMGDVSITENVKHRLVGWLYDYPTVGVVTNIDTLTCFVCSSTDLRTDGITSRGGYTYPLYQCKTCGAWMSGQKKHRKDNYYQGSKINE